MPYCKHLGFVVIVLALAALPASADSFSVQVQGAGNLTSGTSNVSLSSSSTSTNCPALGGCTATIDASASSGPGHIGAYSSAALDITSAYLQYNTSTNSMASFREEGFTISGPSGPIYISFNYTIDGSLSALGTGDVGGIASVSAYLGLGSNSGGYNYTLGGMDLYSDGTLNQSGIFANLLPQNAAGQFVSPRILTFAGDTYVSFGLQINTSAVAGTNAGSGAGNMVSDFSHTMMFSTSGPVVNVFDSAGNDVTSQYTINTSDGRIVNNHFAPTVPEPASLLLFASGLAALASLRKRIRR